MVQNKYLSFASQQLKDLDNNTSDLLNYKDTSNLLQTNINALPQRMNKYFTSAKWRNTQLMKLLMNSNYPAKP
jgi:hypothetical protein